MPHCRYYFFCLLIFFSQDTQAHPFAGMYAPFKQHYSFQKFQPSPCFLILLVDAPHLDYSSTLKLLKSIGKHPRNGCKDGTVGHAWIYLYKDGWVIEGGHSGETGVLQPKYFEGVMDLVECGDPDPIKYLWAIQKDGFFQRGAGRHKPTLACGVHLDAGQYQNILKFIQGYSFKDYSLRAKQCTSFVMEVAALAGLNLEGSIQIPISRRVRFNGDICLWSNPFYSNISMYSPDVLELSLLKVLQARRGADALSWYKKNKPGKRKCCSFRTDG